LRVSDAIGGTRRRCSLILVDIRMAARPLLLNWRHPELGSFLFTNIHRHHLIRHHLIRHHLIRHHLILHHLIRHHLIRQHLVLRLPARRLYDLRVSLRLHYLSSEVCLITIVVVHHLVLKLNVLQWRWSWCLKLTISRVVIELIDSLR